jgi:hypothetical protein
MKAIMKNLQDEILHPTGRVMFCRVCGAKYSANAGDYFMLGPKHKFSCCGQTMELGVPYSGVRLVR